MRALQSVTSQKKGVTGREEIVLINMGGKARKGAPITLVKLYRYVAFV
jgi:hypothetical protein